MRVFYALVKKNFKNLFRNWTSIFVLIIGPLLVMATLILAFSDLGFHNINIGVVGPESALAPIRNQINHLGNFHSFQNLDQCKDRLKMQKVHLCLDVSKGDITNVDIHFDNTREIISFILVNQIRNGITRQKDVILRGKTHNLLDSLRQTRNFIGEKQGAISDAVIELEGYKVEIISMRSEISVSIAELNQHIFDLQALRSEIVFTQSSFNSGYYSATSNTRANLNNAKYNLQQAKSTLIFAGFSTWQVDNAINSLNSLDTSLNQLDGEVNNLNSDINNVISEIDDTLASMIRARDFLQSTYHKLGDIHVSLTSRISELRKIDRELESKKSDIGSLENIDIDTLINPFLLNLKPVFEGSERARLLADSGDIDISQDRARQLLSIGSVQTLIPIIISLMICFIAIIISNIIILDEKRSPAFTRNKISPMSWFLQLSSILFTILIIVSVQVAVILGIGYSVFLLDFGLNLWSIVLVSVLLILIYSLLGISLGYIINSPTTSLLVAAFFLIINIFLSGMVFPIERMSPIMFKISAFIPFRDGVSILQQSIFYQVPFSSLSLLFQKLFFLLLLAAVILCLCYSFFIRMFEKGR